MRPDFNERSHLLLRERRKQGIASASPKHGARTLSLSVLQPLWVNALADFRVSSARSNRSWTRCGHAWIAARIHAKRCLPDLKALGWRTKLREVTWGFP